MDALNPGLGAGNNTRAMSSMDHELMRDLVDLKSAGLHRSLRPVEFNSGTTIEVGGRKVLNFASNDYLGLSRHPMVMESTAKAVRDWGAGSTASRLICGSLKPHHLLEEQLSAWKGTPACLTFSSGYAAALGTIPALVGSGDIVIIDKRVHACCVDAARLSGATLRVFRHNDLSSLEWILKWARRGVKSKENPRVLIITESVFSMDGDLAPLRDIVEMKDRHGAWLMLDEAHALGLFGANRSGLAHALDLSNRIEVQMGTLGKALGSSGGYIAGSRILIDLLIQRARSLMFSTAPSPAATAGALAAIQVVESEEGKVRSEKAWSNALQISNQLNLPQMPTSTIVPIILGSEQAAVDASQSLYEAGFWVPAIRYPTVAKGAARLRLSFSATQDKEHINSLVIPLRSICTTCRTLT